MKVNNEYQTWKPIALYIVFILGLLFIDTITLGIFHNIMLSMIWTVVVLITGVIDYKKYHNEPHITSHKRDNTKMDEFQ